MWAVSRLNYKITEALVVDYKASRSVFFACDIPYHCNYRRNPYIYKRYFGINGEAQMELLDGAACLSTTTPLTITFP
jgi:hypothetical protein